MKKSYLIGAGVLVIIIIAAIFMFSGSNKNNSASSKNIGTDAGSAGAGAESKNTGTNSEVMEDDNVESTVSDTSETSLGLDAAGDCSILTPEDIMNVCGVETTKEIQEPKTEKKEVCRTRFVKSSAKYADRIYQSATIRYDEDYNPDTDDVNTIIENYVNNLDAEKLSDNAVFVPSAGDWSVIYGTKYRIVVQNTVPTRSDIICTPDQIKTLGILVSERIYE